MSDMNQEMSSRQKLYTELIHRELRNLKLYVRDTSLAEAEAIPYETGAILYEKGFTDASNLVGGMTMPDRFTILSNHMEANTLSPDNERFGWFRALPGSRFKVLDIYLHNGKRQILLLHLPDDENWGVFQSITTEEEREIVKDARAYFDKTASADVIPALQEEQWIRQCKKPIGLDKKGIPYDLNPTLPSQMLPVSGPGFRAFYHQFFYLDCRSWLEENLREHIGEEETGILAYGCINHDGLLCFIPVRLAALGDHSLRLRKIPTGDTKEIGYTAVKDNLFLDLGKVELNLSQYTQEESKIRKTYDLDSDGEALRELTFLDAFRSDAYPDVLSIYLIHTEKGKEIQEHTWCRLSRFTGSDLYGVLLQEPKNDFGVRKGETLSLLPGKTSSGDFYCYCPC